MATPIPIRGGNTYDETNHQALACAFGTGSDREPVQFNHYGRRAAHACDRPSESTRTDAAGYADAPADRCGTDHQTGAALPVQPHDADRNVRRDVGRPAASVIWQGGSIAALALTATVVLAGVARIYSTRLTVDQGGTLVVMMALALPLLIHASRPRPALSRGLMAEKQNVTVISSATPDQIRRAALKIDQRKYPRHAEVLAIRQAELQAVSEMAHNWLEYRRAA